MSDFWVIGVLKSQHELFLRKTHELAVSAGKRGNEPFGAILVHNGMPILEAENTVVTDNDYTRHAELNLVVKARRSLSKDTIYESTLYASTAPCLMCSAAIFSAGITRIVYSVGYNRFSSLISGKYRSSRSKMCSNALKLMLRLLGQC